MIHFGAILWTYLPLLSCYPDWLARLPRREGSVEESERIVFLSPGGYSPPEHFHRVRTFRNIDDCDD
jgi:hypothetical protein